MRHFKRYPLKENPPARGVLRMLAFAGLLAIAQLASGTPSFISAARAEIGNAHSIAHSNRDHDKSALAGTSLGSGAAEAASSDPASAGSAEATAGTGSTTGSAAAADPVGAGLAGTSTGTNSAADTTTTAGSDASASATISGEGSINTTSKTTTRSIENANVSMSFSISRATVMVQEPDGTAVGRAISRSRSLALNTPGQQSVKVTSTSKATIHTTGTITDPSISVATDGSAEAAIADGPSASATSSAEATIGP